MQQKIFKGIIFIFSIYLCCIYANTSMQNGTKYTITDVSLLTNKDQIISLFALESEYVFVLHFVLKDIKKELHITPNILTQHKELIIDIPELQIQKQQNFETPLGVLHIQTETFNNNLQIRVPLQDTINCNVETLHKMQSLDIGFFCKTNTNQVQLQKPIATEYGIMQNFDSSYEISSWRYFLVIGIMLAVLVLLYFIRLRQGKGEQTSNIIIEQTKILDAKNKILIIRHNEMRYILGINQNHIVLIDKIMPDNNKQSQDTAVMNNTIEKDFLNLLNGK